MNRFIPHPIQISAVLLALVALPAQAQVARSFSSSTYTGVGVSQLDSGFDNLGKAVDLDAIAGFQITPALNWGRISAELNIGITVSPGKNKGASAVGGGGGVLGGGSSTSSGNNTASSNDLQAQNFGLYGVYRCPGRLYGMGLAGYTLTNTNIQEIQDRGRSSVSFGGGAGFRFGEETAAVEVLYQYLSKDLSTIGVRILY